MFIARGVRNVEYTWNTTSNGYRVPTSDPRSAPKWYPGNAYVDNFDTAAHNPYECESSSGQSVSLANRPTHAARSGWSKRASGSSPTGPPSAVPSTSRGPTRC